MSYYICCNGMLLLHIYICTYIYNVLSTCCPDACITRVPYLNACPSYHMYRSAANSQPLCHADEIPDSQFNIRIECEVFYCDS